MPSRKQRRRDEKLRRHEYVYVDVDEEGREVEVDPASLKEEKRRKEGDGRAPAGRAPATRPGRAGRPVQPPSWSRVGKRTVIFAPLMFIFVYLTSRDRDGALAASLLTTLVMVAVFVPFMYLVDSLMYRAYLKRTGQAPPRPPRER